MARGELIIVGISGGVDSAVAALCLQQAGFTVQGLHMTNWEDADAYCTAADDLQAARRVCDELGIPLHQANFSTAYREQVFAGFLAECRAGRTPNPDVLCNRHIKFGTFLGHARRLGAWRIATGHLAPGLMPAAPSGPQGRRRRQGPDLFPARRGRRGAAPVIFPGGSTGRRRCGR
ncbi:MAG: hypothetical protein U1F72_05910 [Gammaproteobacteria bacterium]